MVNWNDQRQYMTKENCLARGPENVPNKWVRACIKRTGTLTNSRDQSNVMGINFQFATLELFLSFLSLL